MQLDTTCGCYPGCRCGGWIQLVGRVLLAAIFLIIGWGKLTNFSGTVPFVAAGGFPMPEVFTALAIIFELGGAIMLILGFHARLGAWMLIAFTAISTAAYHNAFADPSQQLMMLKNLSIIGGLFYVAAYGAGRYSLKQYDSKWCFGGRWCPDCKVAAPEVPRM